MIGLDRFGGPETWDRHCEEEDAARAAIGEVATCLDCGRCEPCGRGGFEGVGWCREEGDFVFAEDGTVAYQGLECFEA